MATLVLESIRRSITSITGMKKLILPHMSALISDRFCLECSVEGESEAVSNLGRKALPSTNDTCHGHSMERRHFYAPAVLGRE